MYVWMHICMYNLSICLSVYLYLYHIYIFIPISLSRERLTGNLAGYSSLIRKPIIFYATMTLFIN